VLVVIEENHSLQQMRTQMPYLARLSDQYAYATNWTAFTHPSEPNYLALVGGSMFGVTNDGPPAENAPQVGSATSVFGQALGSGKTAVTYAESMPQNCALVNAGHYAVRHNPWTYFESERSGCARHDISTATFPSDASGNRLPTVGFLIPNLIHDAHSAPLSDADTWLHQTLAPVLSSTDFKDGALAVIITADEDDRSSGNTVLTAVLHPSLHHKVVSTPLNHYSLTRYIADIMGVPPLLGGRNAPDMRAAFGL
jgi:acid phosphatase